MFIQEVGACQECEDRAMARKEERQKNQKRQKKQND